MFSAAKKVPIAPELHDRAAAAAAKLGYASVAEFVEHLIEKELRDQEGQESKERLLQKMKGLGYLQ